MSAVEQAVDLPLTPALTWLILFTIILGIGTWVWEGITRDD